MTKKLMYVITSLFVVFGMLSTAPSALADSHGGNKGELKGTISAVDATTVTVTPRSGGVDVVFNVDATTYIKRNNASALITDLLVGDKAEVKYDNTTMLAAKIEAKSPPTNLEVEGFIAAVGTDSVTITPKKGGADVIVLVDAATVITRNRIPALLTDLLVGDKVEAKYDRVTMLASKIEAKSLPTNLEVEGVIAAVATDSVTITPKKGGADVTVLVDATTSITRSGKPALLTDLLVGDKVEAKYDRITFLASKIKAKAKPVNLEVEGVIAAVGVDSLTITPKKGGADVTVLVDVSTRIKRGGKPALLTDLLVGERVEAKYNTTTMIASKIDDKTKAPSNKGELHGIVSAIDLTLGTVTISPSNGGADVTLTVDASTRIQRGHAVITLADLLVGDKVEAKYDKTTFLASKIEVKH
ncbi:MAG: hypothetical protein HZB50_16490 [Chloroflexi bacterium]|nr:hypothetical protein [Chloroflexota bacterium]